MAEIRKIRDDAFDMLIREKLQANENFRSLLALIGDVLHELERAERLAQNDHPMVVTTP